MCKTTEFAARNPQEWNRLKNWQLKKKSYQQQKGSNKSYANVVEEEFVGDNKDVEEEVVPTSSLTTGDYLVIAGAYKSEANAQAEVDRLKGSGYPNAEIIEFDFSDYYSVCVAKYITSEDANAVANSIKSKSGKKAYVHKKRD